MSSPFTRRRKALWKIACCAATIIFFALTAGWGVGWAQAYHSTRLDALASCPGDVNLDSVRDLLDVVLLIRHVLRQQVLTGDALSNADVNGDSTVDAKDVLRLRQHVVGLSPLADCAAGSPPIISAIRPPRGQSGGNVRINGQGFGATSQLNKVTFSDTEARILSASTDQLEVEVPAFSSGGFAAKVIVTANGRSSRSETFVVDRFEPRVRVSPLGLGSATSPPLSMNVEMDRGDLLIDLLRIVATGVQFRPETLRERQSIGRAYISSLYFGSVLTFHGRLFVESIQGSQVGLVLDITDGSQFGTMKGEIRTTASGFTFDLFLPSNTSDIMNDFNGLLAAGLIQLMLHPGLVTLPAGNAQAFQVDALARSIGPLAGEVMERAFPGSFATLDSGVGAPKLLELLPYDPSYMERVFLNGSGFSTIAAESRVTFTGPGGSRIPATVLSAAANSLEVEFPQGAIAGPVRVERGGAASNEIHSWSLFSPAVVLTLARTTPNTGTGITLQFSEPRAQLGIQNAQWLFSSGNWDFAVLTRDAKVGQFAGMFGPLSTGSIYYPVNVYVEDTDAKSWASLVLKSSSGEVSQSGRFVLFGTSGGRSGLLIACTDKSANNPLMRMSDSTGRLTLDAAVFRTPAAGTLTVRGTYASTPAFPGSGYAVHQGQAFTLEIR